MVKYHSPGEFKVFSEIQYSISENPTFRFISNDLLLLYTQLDIPRCIFLKPVTSKKNSQRHRLIYSLIAILN